MRKCAKDIAKTILSVSLHAMEKMLIKTSCRVKSERQKFILQGNCANNMHKDIVKCSQNNIKTITAINKNSTKSNTKIPLMCCSQIQWKNCVVGEANKRVGGMCTAANVDYLDMYFEKAMLDPMNIFCADYQDSDKCDTLMRQLPTTDSIRLKYATLFPALIELFESL
ncbi:unnamed protein product [Oppiella nova]|uniref:Uncharacterized protein n=1 Tax=Oppiella nova TaxID=334625 RepID=A0A7R9MA33_9ACAR|nr:unnamed protein product [Oppiella nova]CAG2173602.1 unnamed protein product [Oppiella nova]